MLNNEDIEDSYDENNNDYNDENHCYY